MNKTGSSFSNTEVMKKRTNLEITIISARLGCAKEELLKDTNYSLRLNFTKKNVSKKIEERIKTEKVKLKDSLMYFNEEKIILYHIINFSTDIDTTSDYLEVSFSLINEKEKIFKPSIVKFKDLIVNSEKDDLWTLVSQSLINLKYKIYDEFIKDLLSGINLSNIINKYEINNYGKTDITQSPNKNLDKVYFTNKNLNSIEIKEDICSTSESFKKNAQNSPLIFTNLSSRNTNYFFNTSPIKENRKGSSGTVQFKLSSNQNKAYPITCGRNSDNSFMLNNLNLNASYINSNPYDNSMENKLVRVGSINNKIVDFDLIEDGTATTYETLCEGFFISGLNFEAAKIIQDSSGLNSTCGHSECSILLSYRPEVLFKYQKKENRFELSNLTSSLCFPAGIKICHSNNKDNQIENKCFMNIITNQMGETFYLINLYYYKTFNYSNFQKVYKYDPVRDFLQDITTNSATNSSTDNTNIEKELQICSNLMSSNYKFVPECISFITKFPYVNIIEKCLDSVLILMQSNTNNTKISKEEEIFDLVSYLVNDVPIPPYNKIFKIYIPYNILELHGLYMKELQTLNYPIKILLDTFPAETILTIFNLILLEQKILFVHDDYETLSQITQAFISIINPFEWVNTYIPILSEDFIKYLQSIIPFIM